MAFPFGGRNSHHHHRRQEDEEEDRGSPFPGPPSHPRPPHHHDQYYPPPGTSPFSPQPPGPYYPPPPFAAPTVEHVAHESSYHRHSDPFPRVEHVAHESHLFPRPRSPSPSHDHHHHHPQPPFPHHRPRHPLPRGEDVRVYCEAEANFSLTIRDGSVVLARCNPADEFQHWIKDEKYSSKVKDAEGFPSFALVNKATGQALQHALGATQPVLLTPYRPDEFDQSILWSVSKDVGRGFRTIRMANNIHLNLDAFHGDKKDGGVHDGTVAVLWEWKKGENQKWKLVPYCKKIIHLNFCCFCLIKYFLRLEIEGGFEKCG